MDKEGEDAWIPLPQRARDAIDQVLRKRKAVGRAPLFPAPKSKTRECWDRHYVDQRLYSIAAKTELPQLSAHAFRRKWEEERRQLPLKDRMDASSRKDEKTLNESYLRRDPRRILGVMEEPTKLRSDGGPLVIEQKG